MRLRKSDTSSIFDDSDDEIVANRRIITETFDLDYHPPSKQITGGKSYKKLRNFSVSTSGCKKADQRLMSIRQQSELQRSTVEKNMYLHHLQLYFESASSSGWKP